ncbi:MAG: hypothetical protein ACTSUE_15030 [Promethearchaeota archaeon]
MNLDISFDTNIPLGIFLSICATVFLNLGKGVQRLGADTLGKGMLKKWKTEPEERKKIKIWLVGTLMTAISLIFGILTALFLDRSSTSVALGGIGILSVVIFSFYVIKERISTLQIIAITIIIVGTIILGIQYPVAVKQEPNESFYMFTLIITIISTLTVIICIKLKNFYGFVFGSISGIFNGFGAIAALFATATADNALWGSVINIWTLTGILLGQGAFWTTQYAFKKGGKASLVVPLMSSFQLLIPFMSDIIIYHIPFGPFQIMSFILTLAGIILISFSSSAALNRFISSPADDEQELSTTTPDE